MRIVSLLPAATEWVCALGGSEALVGRSHECDSPAEIQDRPVVTAPTFDADADSAAIDDAVQSQVQEGLSLYEVDLERLWALEPDLIVTQDQCDVCAVSQSDLEARLGDWTGTEPTVFSLQPQTLKDVFDEVLQLGRVMDRLERAMEVLAEGEARLKALRNRVGVDRRTEPEARPSVACIEWLEPLMVAGHWMPDVVEMAGGRPVLAEAGTPTRRVEWATFREADPDVIACMPCGFTLEETRRDFSYLTEREGWGRLSAVRRGRVTLLDGNAYYNRPGVRIYRAIELLASALYPELRLEPPPAPWERGTPTPSPAASQTA